MSTLTTSVFLSNKTKSLCRSSCLKTPVSLISLCFKMNLGFLVLLSLMDPMRRHIVCHDVASLGLQKQTFLCELDIAHKGQQ